MSKKEKITKEKGLYFSYFKHLAFTLILFVVFIVGLSLAFFTYFKSSEEEVEVPNIVGGTVLEGISLLQEKSLKPYIITQTSEKEPMFFIISQQTQAKSVVKKGREIVFTVSVGPAWMDFPDFVGQKIEAVKGVLSSLTFDGKPQKFYLKDVQWVSSNKPFGEVIEQNPHFIKMVDEPVGVSLKVSKEDRVKAPYFLNLYASQALGRLMAENIPYQILYKDTEDERQDGRVIEQNPLAGSNSYVGAPITLTIARWTKSPGNFQEIVYSIPSEYHLKRLKLVLFDRRGRTILFEGLGYHGESLFRSFRTYGNAKVYLYQVEGDKDKYLQEIKL